MLCSDLYVFFTLLGLVLDPTISLNILLLACFIEKINDKLWNDLRYNFSTYEIFKLFLLFFIYFLFKNQLEKLCFMDDSMDSDFTTKFFVSFFRYRETND